MYHEDSLSQTGRAELKRAEGKLGFQSLSLVLFWYQWQELQSLVPIRVADAARCCGLLSGCVSTSVRWGSSVLQVGPAATSRDERAALPIIPVIPAGALAAAEHPEPGMFDH